MKKNVLMMLGMSCCIILISYVFIGNTQIIKDNVQVAEYLTEPPATEKVSTAEIDTERKKKEVLDLVERAIDYVKKTDFEEALNNFTHKQDFIKGDLYIFVYALDGTCIAHGQQPDLVWKNLYNYKDIFGTFVLQEIIKKAREGGGWLTYHWRGAAKVAYVQRIEKDGSTYIVGSGYYPHSKEEAVVDLVKAAVALFNQSMKEGTPSEYVFSLISYPGGPFVLGDLYLFAHKFDGTHVAHGFSPGIVGTSGWDYRDAEGRYVTRELIEKLKKTDKGVWIEYKSRGAPKRAYGEKVRDNKGNYYDIVCGYYPDADREKLLNLVKGAYKFMKAHGKTQALDAFNDQGDNKFRYGDLYIYVYDLKGNCLANGGNPDLVGKNMYEEKDDDGRYYVQALIKKAQEGGGWIDFKLKNSFISMYVEAIDLGVERFIIASGIYPISKLETMVLLASSAVSYLKGNAITEAMNAFTKSDGEFMRGDLYVFAFDFNGICFAYGDNHMYIWKNFMDWKDDDGRPIMKVLINTVKRGPDNVTFNMQKAKRIMHVERVDKDNQSFVVGSSYFV